MRKLIVLNICTMAVLLGSCSSDSKEPDNPEPVTKDVNVEIITDILTKATVTNQYTEGDQMNVVAKAYNKPNADAFCTPSKATMPLSTVRMTLVSGQRFIICSTPLGHMPNPSTSRSFA